MTVVVDRAGTLTTWTTREPPSDVPAAQQVPGDVVPDADAHDPTDIPGLIAGR